VLSRVLEGNKPRPKLEAISTKVHLPPAQTVSKASPNLGAQQSALLLPPRPPSPRSIRSTRTVASIVSDVRSFTAKSFDTFLVPNAPPHDPRQTPLWSAPRQPLCPEPSITEESTFFPHVPVQLPPDSSPHWGPRRSALERLNDSVKFPVMDVARYTQIPPSPGEGGNWRWKEVEKDPWQNRRQHRQSSLSSGLDGIWKFSHKWRQWRRCPEEGDQMQTGAEEVTVLEETSPFEDNTDPLSSFVLVQKPVLNINKPLPPTPVSVRSKVVRRLSAIRTWRPTRSRAVTRVSESPATSASSSLVSLVWTEEDNAGYEDQKRAEDEDILGQLLAKDWHATNELALPGFGSPGPKRKAKMTDSGVYLSPIQAMKCL
ncbi:hypothetical protein FRC01_013774, partial [Tulasnella sp. 417]